MKREKEEEQNEPVEKQEEDIDKSQLVDISENFVDKNVIRRRILDRLGEKLIKFDQTKNNDYFRSNFYDPLVQDMLASFIQRTVHGRQTVSQRLSDRPHERRCETHIIP